MKVTSRTGTRSGRNTGEGAVGLGVEQQRVRGPGVNKRCTARRRLARPPRSAVPAPLSFRPPASPWSYPRRLGEARRALARQCFPDPLRVERRAAPASSGPRRPRRRARRPRSAGTSPAAAAARRWRTASCSLGRSPATVSRRCRDAAGIPRSYRAPGRFLPCSSGTSNRKQGGGARPRVTAVLHTSHGRRIWPGPTEKR